MIYKTTQFSDTCKRGQSNAPGDSANCTLPFPSNTHTQYTASIQGYQTTKQRPVVVLAKLTLFERAQYHRASQDAFVE
jgi:hypothetical protein